MFFFISKIIGFLIYPTHLILFLLIIFLILKKLNTFKILANICLFIFLGLIFFGGTNYFSSKILWKLEQYITQSIPKEVDGVILLGGSFAHLKKPISFNQVSLGENSERVIEALYLLRKYPKSKIIFCNNENIDNKDGLSEGFQTSLFLKKFEIDKKRFIELGSAQNTYQESVIISNYLSSHSGNWVLVTSASHMPRSIALFQSRKLNDAKIYPYPTDFSVDKPKFFNGRYTFHLINFGNFRNALHEYLGLFAYWISGRTSRIWPDLDIIPVKDQ